jgi:hypothetical protein
MMIDHVVAGATLCSACAMGSFSNASGERLRVEDLVNHARAHTFMNACTAFRSSPVAMERGVAVYSLLYRPPKKL